MADLSVVMEKLYSFTEADDLADFLYGYGIQARPRSASTCAISEFIKEETNLNDVTTTMYNGVRIWNGGIVKNAYPPTEAMTEFVRNYDMGLYPNLIAPRFVGEGLDH